MDEFKAEAEIDQSFVNRSTKVRGSIFSGKSPDDDGDWQPYVGDRGGTGWTNGESVVYDDEPPGPVDVSEMSPEQMGEFLTEELSEYKAETIFDEAESRETVEEAVEIQSDPNKELQSVAPDSLEPGDTLYHPKAGALDIGSEVGDIKQIFGPEAGYIDLEGDYITTLNGDEHEETPDDIDEENILSIADGFKVQEIDDFTPDEANLDDVEFNDTQKSISNGTDPDATSPRLEEEAYDEFWNEIENVHKQEAEHMQELISEAKSSSYSPEGRLREMAFLQAVGRDDELDVRNGALDDGSEPTEELSGVAEKIVEGSQEAFRDEFGESTEVHRGTSETAFTQLLEEAITRDDGNVTLNTFGMSNYATEPTVGEKFAISRKTANVTREAEADDVLAWTDYISRSMNESEIAIEGDDTEIPLGDIDIPWADGTLDEELDNPSPEFEERLKDLGLFEQFEEEYL